MQNTPDPNLASALSITPLGPAVLQWTKPCSRPKADLAALLLLSCRSCWGSSAPAPVPRAAASVWGTAS